MKSRSPGAYAMSRSSWAQRVSRRFPARGETFSVEERRPIQRKPAMMRSRSDSEGKPQTVEMCGRRLLNEKLRQFSFHV